MLLIFFMYGMLNSKIAGVLALLCLSVLCKEIPVDEQRSTELYRSGKVHDGIMAAKMVKAKVSQVSLQWLKQNRTFGKKHLAQG